MDKKNEKKERTNRLHLGEITTIRDILMGQQMEEYEERFENMEAANAQQNQEVKSQLQELERKSNERMAGIEKNINDRLSKLEKILQENLTSMNQKVEDNSKGNRQMFGKLLMELGEKIMKD